MGRTATYADYNHAKNFLPRELSSEAKVALAQVMAKSIIELVIPVIELRCEQLAEAIADKLNESQRHDQD